MNKRVFNLDLIRAICTIMIFTFHFNMGTEIKPVRVYSPNLLFHNIDMGSMGVTMFFMLSGCGMFYSDSMREFSLNKYIKKRFLAIYPYF